MKFRYFIQQKVDWRLNHTSKDPFPSQNIQKHDTEKVQKVHSFNRSSDEKCKSLRMLRFQLQRLQDTLSQGHTICGQHWSPENKDKLLLANSYWAHFWTTPWPLQAQSNSHIHVQPCWYLPTPHNQRVRHQCRPNPQLKEDPGLTQEIHIWPWHTMSSFWTSSRLSKCIGDSPVIANNFVEDHKN